VVKLLEVTRDDGMFWMDTHQEKWEMEIVGNNLIFPLISSNFL